MMTELYYPLAVLALEVDASAAELADRYRDVVLVDEIGRQCLDAPDAARVIREHRDQVAARAERDARRRAEHKAELAALPHPQDRVKAMRARQAELRAAGIIDADTPALLTAMASANDSGLHAQERRGRIMDDLLRQERDPDRPGGHVAGATMPTFTRKERQ